MDKAILHSDIAYICEHRNEIVTPEYDPEDGLEDMLGERHISKNEECWKAGMLGNLEVIKYFYYLGHNVETCLESACHRQYCDVVDWLATRIPLPADIIFCACQNGNINIFNTLIAAGANLNIPGWSNPMLTACRRGHNHIILQLYLLGLNVNQQHQIDQTKGDSVTNALATACRWNLVETVRLLLDLGAIPVQNENGQLPHETSTSLEIKEMFKDTYYKC